MKIISAFLICLLCSCVINKNLKENDRNIELLKQLAYCKYMEQSLGTFGKLDTLEMYTADVRNAMYTDGLFTKTIDPILDSLAFSIVINSFDAVVGAVTHKGPIKYQHGTNNHEQ